MFVTFFLYYSFMFDFELLNCLVKETTQNKVAWKSKEMMMEPSELSFFSRM